MDDVWNLLQDYVVHSMPKVQGYLTRLDANIIASLLSCQSENNIRGHLCEVGVHHGRLFLMLALARRGDERALAIDLFEDDAINSSSKHAGRDTALFSNARRLGIDLSEQEIFKTSSLDINAADVLRRTTGCIRFFSIDGCHFYDGVENDLRLAEQTVASDGIIAIDDFFNAHWADVSFATSDFLRRTPALVPFAISSKLYLAAPAVSEKYQSALCKRLGSTRIDRVQIMGRSVLAPADRMLSRVYEMIRGAINRRLY
jgi:Methyltransferase domain